MGDLDEFPMRHALGEFIEAVQSARTMTSGRSVRDIVDKTGLENARIEAKSRIDHWYGELQDLGHDEFGPDQQGNYERYEERYIYNMKRVRQEFKQKWGEDV